MKPNSPRDGYRRFLVWSMAALLGGGCLLLYWHTTGFDFVLLDDDVNIFFNPHLGALTRERLYWMWTDYEYVRRFAPLGWMGLSAIYTFWGLNPAGYHLALVVLHAINAVLVYVLLLRIRGWVTDDTEENPWPWFFAWLAATAWAVNPMALETIAWSSGFIHAQAHCFCLLALIVYSGLLGPDQRSGKKLVRGAVALLLYTCSLLSYPIALGVMPAVIGLEYWLIVRHQVRGPAATKRTTTIRFFRERMAFFFVPAAVLAITVFSRYHVTAWGEVPGVLSISLAERLAQSAYVLTYYLWKPWLPFDLSPIYTTLIAIDPWTVRFLASMGIVALVVLACSVWPFFRRRAGPWLVAYAVMMTPFLGLTERPHMTYDRYVILPGLLMAMAGVLLRRQIKAAWFRGLVAVTAMGVITAWASSSYHQSWVWKDSLSLHRHIAGQLADTEFPLFKYRRPAFVLLTYGREAEAADLIGSAQARFPEDPFIIKTARDFSAMRENYRERSDAAGEHVIPLAIQHLDAGLAYVRQGQWREGEEHFRWAMALAPHYYIAAYNRALCLLRLNRPIDALHCYLWAKAYAGSNLSADSQRVFLEQLSARAAALGDARLAELAGHRVKS